MTLNLYEMRGKFPVFHTKENFMTLCSENAKQQEWIGNKNFGYYGKILLNLKSQGKSYRTEDGEKNNFFAISS